MNVLYFFSKAFEVQAIILAKIENKITGASNEKYEKKRFPILF